MSPLVEAMEHERVPSIASHLLEESLSKSLVVGFAQELIPSTTISPFNIFVTVEEEDVVLE